MSALDRMQRRAERASAPRSHGAPHDRGHVAQEDARHVRDQINSALSIPNTLGSRSDGTEVTDEWIQPTGEVGQDGAPVYELVQGGTQHWIDVDEEGELEISPFEARLVERLGDQRARAAVQAALERGPRTPTQPTDPSPNPPPPRGPKDRT